MTSLIKYVRLREQYRTSQGCEQMNNGFHRALIENCDVPLKGINGLCR